MFELYDPKGDLHVRRGHLPHWWQPGVTYFVTFRTADSVPQPLTRAWHARRSVWLREHGIEPANPNWKAALRKNAVLQGAFDLQFSREFLEYLDRGHGACLLRDSQNAAIVADVLRHFDQVRYNLGDFVIMPNHVHLLVCLKGDTDIEAQCAVWKRFAAARINAEIGRRGRLWQSESFDHLVRDSDQFERCQRYIAANPTKARLRDGEYLLWQRQK
ncbi:MAG: transposase [Pirellulales bacterium]